MITHIGEGSMEQYIYLLLVYLVFIETEAAHSECEAPAAQKGSAAIVTCMFDSDISKHRQDFEVRRVPVNVSALNAEVVLSCHWNQDNPLCRRRPDYQLAGPVTSQVTVKITKVGNQHAGKFICMLVSHNPGTYGYCELVVTESQTSTFRNLSTTKLNTYEEVYTRSVRHNEDTSGFSILNGNKIEQHKELTSTLPTYVHGNSLAIALAIPTGVTILAISICVIFFILRKTECCKIFSKGDKSANQNSTEEKLIMRYNVNKQTTKFGHP